MARKEEGRPIYEELQGYLQQADTVDAYNLALPPQGLLFLPA